MKKAAITITLDEAKANALRLYLAQKDSTPEAELEKAAEALYGKYVPAGVREFLELNAENKTARPRKPKAALPETAEATDSTQPHP